MPFTNPIRATMPGNTTASPEREGKVRFIYVDRPSSRELITHESCKESVEKYLSHHKPYLKTRYSLDELSISTGIPRHRLSAFFMKEYGESFPSLLNRLRVAHLESNKDNPEWERFTLEGIGRECGFNSRNSFIKSVKRFMGIKPSELLRRK
jgi:AraC-like DNA-binding protein